MVAAMAMATGMVVMVMVAAMITRVTATRPVVARVRTSAGAMWNKTPCYFTLPSDDEQTHYIELYGDGACIDDISFSSWSTWRCS